MSFKSDFFRGNRNRLKQLADGNFPIILTANGLLQRSGDVTYPFRQDSSFWYFTGINDPDLVLVIDQDTEYLIIPNISHTKEVFDGSTDTKYLSETSGVTRVIGETDGWRILEQSVIESGKYAGIKSSNRYESTHGFYPNPSRRRLNDRLKNNSTAAFIDIAAHIISLRMIKQAPEIDAIKTAIDITSQALVDVVHNLPNFKNEKEVVRLINTLFAEKSVVHAYQPIVASGKNACTLHYINNDSFFSKKDLLLIDVGAEFNNYSSDITRTFSTGTVTKRQKDVYNAVGQVQEFALDLLRPGITIREYEKKVEGFMGQKLIELKLISRNDTENVRKYYPHATSHHLGLDTHDAADYDAQISENMILTVEPGIYIPEESIGIRIEDDVRVCKNSSPEVLSKNLSSDCL